MVQWVRFQLTLGRRRTPAVIARRCFGQAPLPNPRGVRVAHLLKCSSRPLVEFFCVSQKRRYHLSNATCGEPAGKALPSHRLSRPPRFIANTAALSNSSMEEHVTSTPSPQCILSSAGFYDRWIQRGETKRPHKLSRLFSPPLYLPNSSPVESQRIILQKVLEQKQTHSSLRFEALNTLWVQNIIFFHSTCHPITSNLYHLPCSTYEAACSVNQTHSTTACYGDLLFSAGFMTWKNIFALKLKEQSLRSLFSALRLS